jgi:peptidoglycan-binding protein ArfA
VNSRALSCEFRYRRSPSGVPIGYERPVLKRRPRRLWLVGALLVPVLLALTGVLVRGHRIEDDLGRRVALAIAAAGHVEDGVRVDGRSVTVDGVVPREAQRVRDVVATVPGVAAVAVHDAKPGELLFFVRANEIVLAGTPADETEGHVLLESVRARTGSNRITDVLTPVAGLRLPVTAYEATAIIGTVIDNGVHDFSGVIRDGGMQVRATVVDDDRADILREMLANASGELRVEQTITAGSSSYDGDLDLRALGDSINRLVGGNGSIRFQPESAEWQGHGPVLIERVGRMLLVAPRASVTVLGHASASSVDAHGLAENRARLVRDVLVGQGVSPALVETAVSIDNAPESTDAVRQVDILVR